jgi:hypothetical protein
MENKYYICGGSDTYWMSTNAKTINGAKAIASKTYQQAPGGKIEVGEKFGEGETERIEKVAVKHGYDNWRSTN